MSKTADKLPPNWILNCSLLSCLSYALNIAGGCSSGSSCLSWAHQDSPETAGGRSKCQPSEQGDCVLLI